MVKIVFFGSSNYSVIILKKLIEIKNFDLVAIVTKTDKAVGRKKIITSNPVALFAKKNNLNLIQVLDFDQDFTNTFKSLNSDLALVVAFGPPYFTQELIDIPKHKIVNIHPSPLPKYRGATPGPWQIINGETNSAVTFFQIDALPDHGPVIKKLLFKITSKETATSFYNKAFNLTSENLEEILKNYLDSPTKLEIQDHSQKTYFPKFTKDTAKINWSWDPQKIYRFINALNLWPIAWTFVKNQQNQTLKIKILSSKVENNKLIPQLVKVEGKNTTNWSEISKYYSIITE